MPYKNCYQVIYKHLQGIYYTATPEEAQEEFIADLLETTPDNIRLKRIEVRDITE